MLETLRRLLDLAYSGDRAREALAHIEDGLLGPDDDDDLRLELCRRLERVCVAHSIIDLEGTRQRAVDTKESQVKEARWRAYENNVWQTFLGMSEESFRGFMQRLTRIATSFQRKATVTSNALLSLADEVERANRGLAISPLLYLHSLEPYDNADLIETRRAARKFRNLPKRLTAAAQRPKVLPHVPRVLKPYIRYVGIRRRWIRNLFSLNRKELAAWREAELFDLLAREGRRIPFKQVGVLLAAIYPVISQTPALESDPRFDGPNLKRKYFRFLSALRRRMVTNGINPPHDELVSAWLGALTEVITEAPTGRLAPPKLPAVESPSA